MKTHLLTLLGILAFTVTTKAQIYQGTTNLGGAASTLDITMDTRVDSVYMEFSGPSSGYYAVGFGGFSMTNRYAVIVNSNGTVNERKLGNHNAGISLTNSVSYSATVSGTTRTALIDRARVGASSDHFTFPANGGSINLIWARGGTTFSNHGGANRGVTSINLVDQCNFPTTVLPTKSICPGDSVQVFGSWVKQPGTFTDSLITSIGCDSLIQQTVQYTPPVVNTLPTLTACLGDTLTVFGQQVSGTTTLYDSLTTNGGCDSVVAQQITFNAPSNVIEPAVNVCAGDSAYYLGAWRSDSGAVVLQLQNAAGCDSVVTGQINIWPLADSNSVWQAPIADATLLAGTDTMATYYWFNCANPTAILDTTMGIDTNDMAATDYFLPLDTGYYAALVSLPGHCDAVSPCTYAYMSISEYSSGISIRPNPVVDQFEVFIDDFSGPMPFTIFNGSGQLMIEGTLQEPESWIPTNQLPSGIYFLKFTDGRTIKFMKR